LIDERLWRTCTVLFTSYAVKPDLSGQEI